jgi:hypothetical protein
MRDRDRFLAILIVWLIFGPGAALVTGLVFWILDE